MIANVLDLLYNLCSVVEHYKRGFKHEIGSIQRREEICDD